MSGHRRPTRAQVEHASTTAAELVQRLAARFNDEQSAVMLRDLAGWVENEIAELGESMLDSYGRDDERRPA